jgi:hypothetical protein
LATEGPLRPALDTARIQAPLVIGVTGHRDLRPEDVAELERRVEQIFRTLRQQYPSTPLLLLSPLAEGSDRLVARVALSPAIGARLVVPLPMPAALYEADFQEPGSVEEFRKLLAQASDSFEVTGGEDPGPARNRCYEAVGIYIVRQSQILIALWDGVDAGKVGGTSEVIRFQTEGPAGDAGNLQPPELFPVYHVVTPRKSNPKPAGEPFEVNVIHPPVFHRHQRAELYYDTLFGNLDRFNRLIGEAGTVRIAPALDAAGLSGSDALALKRYAVADALASRFRRKTIRAHQALHGWVMASFVCFVLFAHLGEFRPVWLMLSLLFLIVAVVVHRRARQQALDDQSLDYRAVAEGARVRFFWKIVGIDEPVQDNYLNTQRTELDWIRNGLRGWGITGGRAEPRRHSAQIEFALKHWIDAQARYYHDAGEKHLEYSERMERAVKVSIYATLAAAAGVGIAALVDRLFHYGWWGCPECEWLAWPVIAIEVLLAAGALLHHFGQRMAYAEHAKQYSRMEGIFARAGRIVGDRLASDDLEGARACLLALGKEALAENGEWVLLHRQRPLELPHP